MSQYLEIMKIIMKRNKISFTPTHLYTNTEKEIFIPDLMMKGFSGMLRQETNRDKRMVMYLDIPVHISELGFKDMIQTTDSEANEEDGIVGTPHPSHQTIKLVNANDVKGLSSY